MANVTLQLPLELAVRIRRRFKPSGACVTRGIFACCLGTTWCPCPDAAASDGHAGDDAVSNRHRFLGTPARYTVCRALQSVDNFRLQGKFSIISRIAQFASSLIPSGKLENTFFYFFHFFVKKLKK